MSKNKRFSTEIKPKTTVVTATPTVNQPEVKETALNKAEVPQAAVQPAEDGITDLAEPIAAEPIEDRVESEDLPESVPEDGSETAETGRKPWSLKDRHVSVISPDEGGLSEVSVRGPTMTHQATLLIDDKEKLAEFAKDIADDEGLPRESLKKLPGIIQEKLASMRLPAADLAQDVIDEFVDELGADASSKVKEILTNTELLKALSVVSEEPTGDAEAFYLTLEEKKCKSKQISDIKKAVKRVGKQAKQRRGNISPGEYLLPKYTMLPTGIQLALAGGEGDVRMISNFTAEILEDIHEDDGAEVHRVFKIQASLEGQETTFTLPANEFAALRWPTIHLGARAVVQPVGSNEAHVRAAIQLNSENIKKRTIYKHTGWTKIGGVYVFLHSGGGIDQDGAREGVEVELLGELARYKLPAPPPLEELRECIRQTIALRGLASLPITCALEGAVFRAILGGDCDTTVWISGLTGNGKSELAARYQQHYGAEFDRMALPGNWASTPNSLEAAAHAAKDTVFTIDDFCPRGTGNDISRYHQSADRLIRSLRNQAGRQRLTADGRLRATKTPRCVAVCTGEDVPEGHSLRASMLIMELQPDELDFEKLTGFQKLGSEGVYAKTMAGFAQHLACCYDERMKELPVKVAAYREKATCSGTHKRTPELVANLMVGIEYFLRFALEKEAITKEEHDQLSNEAWEALGRAASAQGEYLADADSAKKFIRLLRSAIASGKAHLLTTSNEAPRPSELAKLVGCELESRDGVTYIKGQGKHVGWFEKDDVYLDLDAAYSVAQEIARASTPLAVSPRTLSKRLRDADLLASHGELRERVQVRKSINKVRRDVLHLKFETLLGDKPDIELPDVDEERPVHKARAIVLKK